MKNQLPRGTQDILEDEVYAWQAVEQLFRDFCYLYNYDEIRTPTFENTSVFKRDNDSSDMVNKEMYTFSPAGSKDSLTLRPEGTAGVIRAYVEHKKFSNPDLPVKYYYIGPMHRHERPQKGRLRIFNQFGVENLGIKSPWIDAETILLGYSILKALGLDVVVELNTLGDETSRMRYKEALQEYFKDHLDELCSDCKRRYEQNPLRILDCKIDADKDFVKNAPKLSDYLDEESREYFSKVLELLDRFEIPYRIEERMVRGLDYYTDTVFEMVLDGEQKGLTILGGGRYDHLVEESGGPAQSGIGFALGMERLLMAMKDSGAQVPSKPDLDAYVLVLDPAAKDYALDILTLLRSNGYRSEMDQMDRSLKAQFKATDRAGAKYLLLIGANEAGNRTVTLKKPDRSQAEISYDELIETLDKDDKHDHE